jgi:hypothetical protein
VIARFCFDLNIDRLPGRDRRHGSCRVAGRRSRAIGGIEAGRDSWMIQHGDRDTTIGWWR